VAGRNAVDSMDGPPHVDKRCGISDRGNIEPSRGILGPGSWFGWLNRLVVLSYCAWLMTVSWRAIQLRRNAVDASV
jgi:hypothetical protein